MLGQPHASQAVPADNRHHAAHQKAASYPNEAHDHESARTHPRAALRSESLQMLPSCQHPTVSSPQRFSKGRRRESSPCERPPCSRSHPIVSHIQSPSIELGRYPTNEKTDTSRNVNMRWGDRSRAHPLDAPVMSFRRQSAGAGTGPPRRPSLGRHRRRRQDLCMSVGLPYSKDCLEDASTRIA